MNENLSCSSSDLNEPYRNLPNEPTRLVSKTLSKDLKEENNSVIIDEQSNVGRFQKITNSVVFEEQSSILHSQNDLYCSHPFSSLSNEIISDDVFLKEQREYLFLDDHSFKVESLFKYQIQIFLSKIIELFNDYWLKTGKLFFTKVKTIFLHFF